MLRQSVPSVKLHKVYMPLCRSWNPAFPSISGYRQVAPVRVMPPMKISRIASTIARGEVRSINRDLSLTDEMEFAAQLMVHRDNGAIDVADQAVAEHHVGDLPIAAEAGVRQRRERDHARGLASGLVAQRYIRDVGQF